MISQEISEAVDRIAAKYDFEPAALKAFVETESAGIAYAIVNNAPEPLIRWEGHYFYRLCSPIVLEKAVEAGLAASKYGVVKNPASQQARWDKLLRPAMNLDMQAALESCSWALGQVMGAHWELLGFKSVVEFVELARSGIDGQIELIALFLIKTGLKGAVDRHDWAVVAKGYNGPKYRENRYDTKMAAAYRKYASPIVLTPAKDNVVTIIQARLAAHGFHVAIDGIRGTETNAAIEAFQKAKGLFVDGIVGRRTMAALNEDPEQ